MIRKFIACSTILAFICYSLSCAIYRTKKVHPSAVIGEDVRVLGVVKTSGEYVEFPEKSPGRIHGDMIVGSLPGSEEIITLKKEEIKKIQREFGEITRMETEDGKMYAVKKVISDDRDKIVFIIPGPWISIPLSEVELVHIKKMDPAMTFMAVIGGVALVAAAVIVVIALTKESCPFIYSWDGTQYVFDAEPYGGAICPGLKRTEWCSLDYLKEVNGLYKILVTNEVDETQYTDELKLAVVDHAPGTRVVPDLLGRMHTVADPISPLRAIDQKGRDLLPLAGSDDWKFWQTRISDARTGDIEDLKDELVFEFPKPDRAKTVKLLFNGCSTLWGSQMIKRILDLQGKNVGQWYEDVNRFGPSFFQTMAMDAREELYRLHIRVETDHGWEIKGTILGGGPFVSEERVYPLDIGDVSGPILRIKLTPPATFWMVNRVAVDYTEDQPCHVLELEPFQARDQRGQDVRECLILEDNRYLNMPNFGDKAEVSFIAPSAQQGSLRSVYLKAGGYYDIHLQAKEEPQTELIRKVLAEPGFVVRYALQEYQKWRETAFGRSDSLR